MKPLFLEIFSGSGKLSKAFRKLDFLAVVVDVRRRPLDDMTIASNRRRVLRLGKRAAWVHIALPCHSFSRARRGKIGSPAGPLRSKDFPWGVPRPCTPEDASKIQTGNKLYRACLEVIRVCRRRGVPVSLKNPTTSMVWQMRGMQRLLEDSVFLWSTCSWNSVSEAIHGAIFSRNDSQVPEHVSNVSTHYMWFHPLILGLTVLLLAQTENDLESMERSQLNLMNDRLMVENSLNLLLH